MSRRPLGALEVFDRLPQPAAPLSEPETDKASLAAVQDARHRVGPSLQELRRQQSNLPAGQQESYGMDHVRALSLFPPRRPYSRPRDTRLCARMHPQPCPHGCRSCHFCRQRSVEPKSNCTACEGRSNYYGGPQRGSWCGSCLWLRAGENLDEVRGRADWLCPACRDLCNCSGANCQRLKRGWFATNQLSHEATSLHYASVAHYLVLTLVASRLAEDAGGGLDAIASSRRAGSAAYRPTGEGLTVDPRIASPAPAQICATASAQLPPALRPLARLFRTREQALAEASQERVGRARAAVLDELGSVSGSGKGGGRTAAPDCFLGILDSDLAGGEEGGAGSLLGSWVNRGEAGRRAQRQARLGEGGLARGMEVRWAGGGAERKDLDLQPAPARDAPRTPLLRLPPRVPTGASDTRRSPLPEDAGDCAAEWSEARPRTEGRPLEAQRPLSSLLHGSLEGAPGPHAGLPSLGNGWSGAPRAAGRAQRAASAPGAPRVLVSKPGMGGVVDRGTHASARAVAAPRAPSQISLPASAGPSSLDSGRALRAASGSRQQQGPIAAFCTPTAPPLMPPGARAGPSETARLSPEAFSADEEAWNELAVRVEAAVATIQAVFQYHPHNEACQGPVPGLRDVAATYQALYEGSVSKLRAVATRVGVLVPVACSVGGLHRTDDMTALQSHGGLRRACALLSYLLCILPPQDVQWNVLPRLLGQEPFADFAASDVRARTILLRAWTDAYSTLKTRDLACTGLVLSTLAEAVQVLVRDMDAVAPLLNDLLQNQTMPKDGLEVGAWRCDSTRTQTEIFSELSALFETLCQVLDFALDWMAAQASESGLPFAQALLSESMLRTLCDVRHRLPRLTRRKAFGAISSMLAVSAEVALDASEHKAAYERLCEGIKATALPLLEEAVRADYPLWKGSGIGGDSAASDRQSSIPEVERLGSEKVELLSQCYAALLDAGSMTWVEVESAACRPLSWQNFWVHANQTYRHLAVFILAHTLTISPTALQGGCFGAGTASSPTRLLKAWVQVLLDCGSRQCGAYLCRALALSPATEKLLLPAAASAEGLKRFALDSGGAWRAGLALHLVRAMPWWQPRLAPGSLTQGLDEILQARVAEVRATAFHAGSAAQAYAAGCSRIVTALVAVEMGLGGGTAFRDSTRSTHATSPPPGARPVPCPAPALACLRRVSQWACEAAAEMRSLEARAAQDASAALELQSWAPRDAPHGPPCLPPSALDALPATWALMARAGPISRAPRALLGPLWIVLSRGLEESPGGEGPVEAALLQSLSRGFCAAGESLESLLLEGPERPALEKEAGAPTPAAAEAPLVLPLLVLHTGVRRCLSRLHSRNAASVSAAAAALRLALGLMQQQSASSAHAPLLLLAWGREGLGLLRAGEGASGRAQLALLGVLERVVASHPSCMPALEACAAGVDAAAPLSWETPEPRSWARPLSVFFQALLSSVLGLVAAPLPADLVARCERRVQSLREAQGAHSTSAFFLQGKDSGATTIPGLLLPSQPADLARAENELLALLPRPWPAAAEVDALWVERRWAPKGAGGTVPGAAGDLPWKLAEAGMKLVVALARAGRVVGSLEDRAGKGRVGAGAGDTGVTGEAGSGADSTAGAGEAGSVGPGETAAVSAGETAAVSAGETTSIAAGETTGVVSPSAGAPTSPGSDGSILPARPSPPAEWALLAFPTLHYLVAGGGASARPLKGLYLSLRQALHEAGCQAELRRYSLKQAAPPPAPSAAQPAESRQVSARASTNLPARSVAIEPFDRLSAALPASASTSSTNQPAPPVLSLGDLVDVAGWQQSPVSTKRARSESVAVFALATDPAHSQPLWRCALKHARAKEGLRRATAEARGRVDSSMVLRGARVLMLEPQPTLASCEDTVVELSSSPAAWIRRVGTRARAAGAKVEASESTPRADWTQRAVQRELLQQEEAEVGGVKAEVKEEVEEEPLSRLPLVKREEEFRGGSGDWEDQNGVGKGNDVPHPVPKPSVERLRSVVGVLRAEGYDEASCMGALQGVKAAFVGEWEHWSRDQLLGRVRTFLPGRE